MTDMEEEFKEAIKIIKEIRPVTPPDGLTVRCMGRIDRHYAGFTGGILRMLHQEVSFSGAWRAASECSFCLFAVGFFFMIIGLVLTVGLNRPELYAGVSHWLLMQPTFILANACLFMLMTAAVVRHGRKALPVVKLGILFFIAFLILNNYTIEPMTIPHIERFIAVFSAASVLMGVVFVFSLEKQQRMNWNRNGNNNVEHT